VRDQMSWQVSSRAAAGVTSPGSLRAGTEYDVTVRGVWKDGAGVHSDAECTRLHNETTWRRDHAREHDVLLDRNGVRFDAVPDTGGNCSADDHVYRYTFTPNETRPVNLRVSDDSFGNNTGALTVTVAPHVDAPAPQPPPQPQPQPDRLTTERLSVSSSSSTPVRTKQSYPAGTRLRLRASGAYSYGGWLGADAECIDGSGWSNRWGGRADLLVNGVADRWYPNDGSGDCDDDNAYYRDITVQQSGPLAFVVADSHRDSRGSLEVTVEVR
jgi:hypothetical protein